MELAKRHTGKSAVDIFKELLDQFYIDELDLTEEDTDMIVIIIDNYKYCDTYDSAADSAAAVALIALLLGVSRPEIIDVLFREPNGTVRLSTQRSVRSINR